MLRLMTCGLTLFALSSCGWVPPVNLFSANIKPDPANTGIVYYGETLGPFRAKDIYIFRDGVKRGLFSDRAVVVLPAGSYTFVYTEPVRIVRVFEKRPDTPEVVEVPGVGPIVMSNVADGAIFEIETPAAQLLGISVRVSVQPGRCYRIVDAGSPPVDRFHVEEYWPAKRPDINVFCPNSRPVR